MHSIHREQIQRERCELLSTLLLLYELPSSLAGDIRCSGHRVLELVKLIGGAVFSPQAVASADTAGDGFTPGSVAAEAEQRQAAEADAVRRDPRSGSNLFRYAAASEGQI